MSTLASGRNTGLHEQHGSPNSPFINCREIKWKGNFRDLLWNSILAFFWNAWGTQRKCFRFSDQGKNMSPWKSEHDNSPHYHLFRCQCNYRGPQHAQHYRELFTKKRNSRCCLMRSCRFLSTIGPGCQGRSCLCSRLLMFITETNLLFINLLNSRDG